MSQQHSVPWNSVFMPHLSSRSQQINGTEKQHGIAKAQSSQWPNLDSTDRILSDELARAKAQVLWSPLDQNSTLVPNYLQKFPQGMSKGKFQRDGGLLQESEPKQQVANSCLTEKETQSTLKIPSLLQWPYCVKEGAKGLKWEGQMRP